MKKKQISETKKKTLIEEISSLLKKRKSIIFGYIFGSFAEDKKFSDIDIGIFISGEKSVDSLDFEIELEEKIQSFTNLPVDVRIINHAPLSFVYHVIKEGILVKDENPSFRADFEGMIFKKYLDFAFYRKQYLKEVVNAPV